MLAGDPADVIGLMMGQHDFVSDGTWPVSVKAVLLVSLRVLLCPNDRAEWELPGGRLEDGEELEACVVRELKEETGLDVVSDRRVYAWNYEVVPAK